MPKHWYGGNRQGQRGTPEQKYPAAAKIKTLNGERFGDDEGDVIVLFAVGELVDVADDISVCGLNARFPLTDPSPVPQG